MAGPTRNFWDKRFAEGDTPWDRGAANPQLGIWLLVGALKPCRILVPGCGSGYEVAVLAQEGFDVAALDYAPEAIARTRALLDAIRSAGNVPRLVFSSSVAVFGPDQSVTFRPIASQALASAGAGGIAHLTAELFKQQAGGLDITHVPYKGGGPAINDVLANQIAMNFASSPAAVPFVKTDRLRGLAFTGLKRSDQIPDIPTLDEGGIKGYNVATWYIVFGPAKLPRDIVTRLHSELDKVLKDPAIRERYSSMGVNITASTQEQAVKFAQAEHARWAKIIQASGIKAD